MSYLGIFSIYHRLALCILVGGLLAGSLGPSANAQDKEAAKVTADETGFEPLVADDWQQHWEGTWIGSVMSKVRSSLDR